MSAARAASYRLIEWPTVGLALALYGASAALTWHHVALPWWLVAPLGGALLCLHGSLQHEAVHGHPTPWPWLNEILIFPSLWLWLPYRLYRRQHLAHHACGALADPRRDPESFYLSAQDWARQGRAGRALRRLLNTLAGRLLLGPPWIVARLLREEARRLRRGDARRLADWLAQLPAAALTLAWLLAVCRVPLIEYVALYLYPGLALTLLRSYLEHQASAHEGRRTAIVEAGPLCALLFLNNNLHALHHAEPGLAWYRLPARYRARRDALLAENGGYLYRGYGAVLRRHLFAAKEPPAYPLDGEREATAATAD